MKLRRRNRPSGPSQVRLSLTPEKAAEYRATHRPVQGYAQGVCALVCSQCRELFPCRYLQDVEDRERAQ